MKVITSLLVATLLINCGGREQVAQKERQPQSAEKSVGQEAPGPAKKVDGKAALKIARDDFAGEFSSSDDFEPAVLREANGWRITFQLKDKTSNGGGAVYLVDEGTGKILDRKFYQ